MNEAEFLKSWQAAKDAAEAACDNGFHVQRAMDATVADAESRSARMMEGLGVGIARLTKELAEEREKRVRAESQRDDLRSSVCGWIEISNKKSEQLAAAQSALAEKEKELAGVTLSTNGIIEAIEAARDALQKQNDHLKRQLSQAIT